jgi:predicted nucleic acid-binding protein
VSATHFIDTNILLYSISDTPDEARKSRIATDLLDRDGGALSVQVLQEFYVQATRATRASRLTHDTAASLINTWMRFAVQDNTVDVMKHALAIKAKHQLSYWDSAIVAAACAQGCREIWSEDMTHGRQVEGARVVNPFN